MSELPKNVQAFVESLAARDVDRAVEACSDDVLVVRYEGVAHGRLEAHAFLVGYLAGFENYELVSIDQVRASEDIVLWDASNETGAGVLQTTNLAQVDADGLICRYVPILRGYWGRS